MEGETSRQQREQQHRREIVFKGQLQQKIRKSYGTLLRKKKAIYEDEFWVLLCVHEGGTGGIPHLEWYADLRSAYEHRPQRVQDLLGCQYVNVAIGEERCMVIGFMDKSRPVLELLAPSVEERRQWVAKLTETLRRFKCLLIEDEPDEENNNGSMSPSTCCPRAENEYISLNETTTIESNGDSNHIDIHHNHNTGTGEFSNDFVPVPIAPLVSLQPIPIGQKLTLADKIPMHSSPPSTSNSPHNFSPRIEQTADSSQPQSPIIMANKMTATISNRKHSKPIPINSPKQQREPIQLLDNVQSHQQNNLNDENLPMDGRKKRKEGNMNCEKNTKSGSDSEEQELYPPPLPPRKSQTNQREQPIAPPLLPSSPIPSSPPSSTIVLTANGDYDALQNQQHYDHLQTTSHPYQQLSRLSAGEISDTHSSAEATTCLGSLRLSSTSTSTTISTSNSQHSNNENRQVQPRQRVLALSVSSPRNSFNQQYDILSASEQQPYSSYAEQIFHENMAQPRRVSLSLSLLAEHVAFVEMVDKVWVAGWSPEQDTNLRNILHFGDEVLKMAGFTLRTVKQLPEIYANTMPGVQIELTLRANAGAKVYTLTRPSNPKKELGIVLHKRKNKIASIERNSLAERACVLSRLPPFIYNKETAEVPSVIAELDGIPLSLESRNEQFFNRLEKIPIDSAINISLYPYDFCAQILRQLKAQIRHFQKFTHDS